ncbi:MAG TPA: hypothetical protein PK995_07930 [Bacteroidia bacterium]|nr:hypothetical protein [Bacteroidia bacterium]
MSVRFFIIFTILLFFRCEKKITDSETKISNDNEKIEKQVILRNKDTVNKTCDLVIKTRYILFSNLDSIVINVKINNSKLLLKDSCNWEYIVGNEITDKSEKCIRSSDVKIKVTGIDYVETKNKDIYYFVVWGLSSDFFAELIAIDSNLNLCGYVVGGLYPTKDKMEYIFYDGNIDELLYGIFLKRGHGKLL